MTKRSLVLFFAVLLTSISARAASVEWIKVDGAIGPIAHKIILEALDRAERNRSEALVIELDTPGGLLSTTRLICKRLLAAEVPVVVYVSPSGARAGSAGVFITLAANIAAMAHGTNIGAAHPVDIGGGAPGEKKDSSGVMSDKITNDAAAFARTLAERNGKNIEWAEKAVRQSVSATESEALKLGIIDLIASSRDSLLALLEGRVVQVNGQADTLHTAGATVNETPLSTRLRILDFIADPNIAYIFLLLGVYGLFFELYNPGSILPGVVGGLSLILAFFSLQLLPMNWAGLLLILLGIGLFALEIKITSYGLLTVGGVIAMTIGSLMLFDPATTGIRVGLHLILPAAIVTALFFAFVVGAGIRAQREKKQTGWEGMIGKVGTVKMPLTPRGTVLVHGELWEAIGEGEIEKGARVQVKVVEGMTLRVTRAESTV
jgi:membrane-bound serine protease (ClpP class)